VDLAGAGWPEALRDEPVPALARSVLNTVPVTFVGVAAAMAGIHWLTERRQRVAEAEEQAAAGQDDGAPQPPTEDSNKGEQP